MRKIEHSWLKITGATPYHPAIMGCERCGKFEDVLVPLSAPRFLDIAARFTAEHSTCPALSRAEDYQRRLDDASGDPEPQDHSDDPCPCGDPDCSRPFGHPTEEEVEK